MPTSLAHRVPLAMGLTVALAGTAAPASAQGFFEQLFGGGAPAQAPQYSPPPSPFDPGQDLLPGQLVPPAHRRKRVADDGKPVLQKPTDLMHDKTLQAGDAVMMKDGLHVYTGPEGPTHSKRQFTTLYATRKLSSGTKERLASLDPARAETVQEARSATDVVEGYRITDARGRSVRYVGP